MPLPQRRAVVALCAAAALSVPAGTASAQTSAIPEDGAGVSATPPVPLSGGSGDSGSRAPAAGTGDDGALPNTGSDPRLLFLTGLAITLLGVGLRLRTVDAEDY